MTRLHRLTVAAVELAVAALPRGPVRDRYRAELIAELHGASTRTQLTSALSLVLGAPALRRALHDAGQLDFPHTRLWCRARLHHRWRWLTTEDGARYRRCAACGTDDDGTTHTHRANDSIAAVAVSRPN